MKKVIRSIRRSDNGIGMVEGNLIKVKKPKFVSLVGTPANQRAFSVVRSDDTGEEEQTAATAAPVVPRVRRTKRSVNPVLALTFPKDYSEDDVASALTTFAMDDYKLKLEDGQYVAIRSDLKSISTENVTTVKINGDGVTATLDTTDMPITRSAPNEGVKVVAFEFDIKRHDATSAQTWLTQNGVDNLQVAPENPASDLISVKRSEIAEGEEVRRMEIDNGVVAVVARADQNDIPANFELMVIEQAYGNWGWGCMDFDSSFADRQYCEVMETATDRLRRVLDDILFYSSLPLDARKQLVNRSLLQFGNFVTNIMDQLPQQILLLVSRSDAVSSKEKDEMKINGQQTTTNVKRSDSTDTATTAPATTATTTTTAAPATGAEVPAGNANEMVTISRADLSELIRSEVAKATAAAPAAAPATTTAAPAAADAGAATGTAVTENEVTRSAPAQVDIAEVVRSAVAEMVKPLQEQVQQLGSVTIVRSDKGDPVQAAAADAGKGKTKEKEVFRGVLFKHND